MKKIQIKAVSSGYGRFVDLLIGEFSIDGNLISAVKAVKLEPHIEGDYAQPSMSLERQQAQSLMDDLWQCGFRPTQGSGSAGSLAATERHLKDMQTIAMGLLKSQL